MNKIYVVGIGPGSVEQMTIRAINALKASDIIIGYDYYIELLREFIGDKEVFSTPMKKEVERCEKARDIAMEGKTVAIISSGDSGVYGMSGLIYQLCEGYNINIEVIPGITACCSGGAVIGAPLTHDFAVISLSDLLTPLDKIFYRIEMASKADMSICIYNPASKKRADYLERAVDIMLGYKSEDTPCGYVKNIDRQGEEWGVMTLKELKGFKADMFTTVFIGNSQSKIIEGRLVTPRGYKGL